MGQFGCWVMAWVTQYSAANLVGARQEAQLIRHTEQCVGIASNADAVTENKRIIERHLRGIHPLLDHDASESQSMISI